MQYTLIGWSYGAENYSHAGIVSELIAEGRLSPAARDALDAIDAGRAVADLLELMADTECAEWFEKDDSERYPQPIARIAIESDDLDSSVCDLVEPGKGSTYTTWRELLA